MASVLGTGPTTLGGIQVPLTPGPVFNRMLTGWTPPFMTNAFGILDQNGDAAAQVLSLPGLSSYIGRTAWLAAVSYDPAAGAGRLSSVARALTVVP